MKKKLLSILLVAATATMMLAGCGKKEKEADATPENVIEGDASAEDAFVIWGWNEDVKPVIQLFKEDHPDVADRLVFVNTGGTGYYQGKIDAILKDPTNELYPDVMLLEVDYIKKYVDSDYLQPASALGITSADMKDMYQYNIDLCTDPSGVVKAFFWQATPGCWQLRADLCEKYLGTTDPEKLQKDYFSTWEKVIATGEKLNAATDGKCKVLSGYTDLYRVFSNAREKGWYDANNNLVIDAQLEDYIELAKTLYDKELTYNTAQWSTDWSANMTGDGVETQAALAYTGCPWFTYWCLKDAWKSNTILVAGPQQFFWGGTGMAATVECSDMALATEFIKYATIDPASMEKIVYKRCDFVNNKTALEKIVGQKDFTSEYLYPAAKQDFLDFFLPLADSIDATIVTGEDLTIDAALDAQLTLYLKGDKTYDAMIADFKAKVHDTYNFINVQ